MTAPDPVSWLVEGLRTVSATNAREHHFARARRVKEERQLVWAAWFRAGKPHLPRPPCAVTLVRIAPRTLDTDNLSSALKGCRDEVAKLLEIDDADPRVIWLCEQRKSDPRRYAVDIAIEAVG